MGRKLNHPTPTVINTELVPLDESFYIEASGELEQWYYDNSKQFAPNRVITPLTLTPMLSVFDKDTSTSYTPSFYTTRWFVNEYNATQGEYVEREIVNPVDGSSPDYIISGNNLLVKKNVSYTRSVTIRCEATYIDPRDAGVTYTTRDSVILTCNQDATVVFPDVAITSPKARSFNPLTDYKTVDNVEVQDSQFDFDATITNNPEVEGQANDYLAKYEVDGGGMEELVAQDDSITSAPTMQIRYPDGSVEQDATFVKRATAGGTKPTLSGEAVMDSMKGNTVKFNQKSVNGDFSKGNTGLSNWTLRAGSVSVSNNIATITKTSQSQSTNVFDTNVGFTNGHKYFVSFEITYLASNTILYVSSRTGVWGQATNFATTNIAEKIRTIYNCRVDNEVDLSLYPLNSSSDSNIPIASFKNVMVFDLTEMFGSGNEPETVEAFESWLDANVGTYDYYPYTENSLIPVNIKSIKTADSNGDTLDEVPFDITQIKGKLLDASGNPTGNSVVVFPDGLKKVGTLFDEIKVENGVLKAVKRTAFIQNLGLVDWRSGWGLWYANQPRNWKNVGSTGIPKGVSTGPTIASWGTIYGKNTNYVIGVNPTDKVIVYYDDTSSTAQDVQAKLAKQQLIYELTTYEEYILDPIENPFLYKWFGISNGQEVDATTMPWYVSGQNTSKLKVDAMFGESINVVLRAQMPDGTLSPSKAYAGVEWRIPDVDIHVLSNNGGAVRSDTTSMTFDTVANVKGDVLTDARKQQHLRFNWKYRKNTNTTENDAGWGNSVTISASNLRNVKGASSTLASTLVYPYVYVLGAWKTSQGTITGYDKPTLVKDGVTYYRIIDD